MTEESAAEDSDSQFKDIVKDLFNIEVNTILRDRISAQKMPSVRNALMDIGVEYFEILEKAEKAYRDKYPKKYHKKYPYEYRAANGEKSWKILDIPPSLGFFYTVDEYAEAQKEQKESSGMNSEIMMVKEQVCEQLGGFHAFAIMRRWADKFLQDPEFLQDLRRADDLDERKRIPSVLPRIRENADMLKGMFSAICRRELEGLDKCKQLKDKDGQPTTLEDEFKKKKKEKEKGSELTPEAVVQLSWELEPEKTPSWTNQYTRFEIIRWSKPLHPLMKQSELVMVRKIWEVGTEVIAMQTTIQVDGDVITRLNPNYLDEKIYEKLSDYHKEGVNIALRYWGDLVSIARDLVGRLFKGLRD